LVSSQGSETCDWAAHVVNDFYSAEEVLGGLKDFQRASVDHAFSRLYADGEESRRFLIADETGLGKTMVARGVIARTIEHLQHDDSVRRIDIVYVCSNSDIATQNLSKLMLEKSSRPTPATRLTMLIAQRHLLRSSTPDGRKPVTFVSFTPATSFDMGWQTGKAEERAILYLLLAEHLGLDRTESGHLKRLLKGGVKKLSTFDRYIEMVRANAADGWEPSIQQDFLKAFDNSSVKGRLREVMSHMGRKTTYSTDERNTVNSVIADLRRLLARSSVAALEPDLVVLDEFQRFKSLLSGESEAADLAHHLFDQPEARVLLLSATPYKSFTLAEESAEGEDHYRDLIDTLRFLFRDDESVTRIQAALSEFRRAALAGDSVAGPRRLLEETLLRHMSRVERPVEVSDRTTLSAPDVEASDLAGYVALRRVAEAVRAPMTVEYWKSAPYFANFLDGYKVGEKVKEALKEESTRDELLPLLRSTQRLRGSEVKRFAKLDWGNARLRQLASETVDKGWWKLLWVPPSLPYYGPAGPYAAEAAGEMTKRLVFSSWVAAPSAIASLLSYETERLIRSSAGGHFSRESFKPRLQYRITEGRASSMTALGLFWPLPLLASMTDPRHALRDAGPEVSADAVTSWAAGRVSSILGNPGEGRSSQSTSWYWAGPLAQMSGEVAGGLMTAAEAELVEVLTGEADDNDGGSGHGHEAIRVHIEEARRAMSGRRPEVEIPEDYVETVALMGVAGPANCAWRAFMRLLPDDHSVSEMGLWKASALLASGFRTLFNRQEVTLLLDGLSPGDDDSYWRNVLRYCRDGTLQAVLDEYMHNLLGSEGVDPATDDGLLALAQAAHRALTLRGATYRAVDPDHPEGGGIKFFSRFALRYGNVAQEQEDSRLPEVRAAFNSPFWPFVLASTSIGQEGVDFHWWCHAIVHWNLPSNPVDFEQREGRVNRFKGHAIRKNVASAHGREVLSSERRDVWKAVFEEAERQRNPAVGDMQPYWYFPGSALLERSVLGFPMSRDLANWERLKSLLALYRLAYGQPRQEDMIELLSKRGASTESLDSLRLDLSPPGIRDAQKRPAAGS